MSLKHFVLNAEDPVVHQFSSGLEAWERPFDVSDEEPPIPVRTLGTGHSGKFIAGLLGPRLVEAAPAGERALVINTAREVRIKIVDPETGDPLTGFRLDTEGHLIFGLRLFTLPPEEVQTFFIDVLFVPASEIICQQTIGREQRVLLTTMQGLKFDCKLSALDEFLQKWQSRLRREGWEVMVLPKTAFVLRIWWD